MTNLVYYTFGHNSEFLVVLELSIWSLRTFNPTLDILVFCDERFLEECKSKLDKYGNIFYESHKAATTKEASSIEKLNIATSPVIQAHTKCLFLDCDTVIHTNLDSLFDKITNPEILYARTENKYLQNHTHIWYSLQDYTPQQLLEFSKKSIYVLNAGQFGFVQSPIMANHFQNIYKFISEYKGEFYYEQSFLNKYFNERNLTDRSVLEEPTVILFPPRNTNFKGSIIHFTGETGNGKHKGNVMLQYIKSFIL